MVDLFEGILNEFIEAARLTALPKLKVGDMLLESRWTMEAVYRKRSDNRRHHVKIMSTLDGRAHIKTRKKLRRMAETEKIMALRARNAQS